MQYQSHATKVKFISLEAYLWIICVKGHRVWAAVRLLYDLK